MSKKASNFQKVVMKKQKPHDPNAPMTGMMSGTKRKRKREQNGCRKRSRYPTGSRVPIMLQKTFMMTY